MKFKIKSVSFSYRTADWSAFITYESSGDVYGAHLAGNPPFVHEEREKLDKSVIDSIWKYAEIVTTAKDLPNFTHDSNWIAYEEIRISGDKKEVYLLWPVNPLLYKESEAVSNLKKQIMKYKIGGW